MKSRRRQQGATQYSTAHVRDGGARLPRETPPSLVDIIDIKGYQSRACERVVVGQAMRRDEEKQCQSYISFFLLELRRGKNLEQSAINVHMGALTPTLGRKYHP
jgi:hypothetical protein